MQFRRSLAAGLGLLLSATVALPAMAETVLRVAGTFREIPLTSGNPDQGAEGMFAVGYNLYDALINWDLSRSDRPASLTPGLATEWSVDPQDSRRWIFKLRQGVRFHDGSPFNADAVVWNFEKLRDDRSPQYDARQAAQARVRIPSVAGVTKIDDSTVEIRTTEPDAFLPYQISWILFSSPANWQAQGRDWDKVALNPSGTGPWRAARVSPRERLEMVRNTDYWNKNRVPHTDRLVMVPAPDATTRTAALRAGQVDWIEAPAPDDVTSLKQAGFQISTNLYPHIWVYHLNIAEGSPWADVRVRRAANLALDRSQLVGLLNGLAQPAQGLVPPNSPWFGSPDFKVSYDPAAARALLAEAGYGPQRPLRAKVLFATNGSGQMQPTPMNEYVQQSLREVGIEIDFETADWGALLPRWRGNPASEASRGVYAIQMNLILQDPFNATIRYSDSRLVPPRGGNWSNFSSPEVDALIDRARATFDIEQQDRLIAQVHAKIVEAAPFLFVVHDVNPRALSPRVRNFVQAQSWFQDFTQIEMR
jgi:ABC-type transport system substrate-binding protein